LTLWQRADDIVIDHYLQAAWLYAKESNYPSRVDLTLFGDSLEEILGGSLCQIDSTVVAAAAVLGAFVLQSDVETGS
jgi:hypothetical protein